MNTQKQATSHIHYIRLLGVLFLGFASGLPLALTGQAMQAWLTVDGVDIATIGFLSLVGLPYTFKFVWAPLVDRFELPFFGRRRGWIMLTQVLLAMMLFMMSQASPSTTTEYFSILAVIVAFLSATQDIAIDAYRTDVLSSEERGLGASLSVLGYRLAMIISGGVALIWADPHGFDWGWPKTYKVMALIMIVAAVVTTIILPKIKREAPKTNAKNDLVGFGAIVIAVIAGYQFTKWTGPFVSQNIMKIFLAPEHELFIKWADMISLMYGLTITIPFAYWIAKKSNYETFNASLGSYFSQKGSVMFLLFIILYKLGDAFAGSLTTPFLIKAMEYTQAEVGVVNKVIGIWLTIGGTLLGGAIMVRIGLFRSLFVFGILQLISNLGFYWLSIVGKGTLGYYAMPAFDWIIISIKEATQIDLSLLAVIAGENITSGMGTAAFVAFLMALCNQKFTATQYALLSAFASIGRVWVGPLSGVLILSIGWPTFFLVSIAAAAPGMFILYYMKNSLNELEVHNPGLADD